jgi:hypothetical protein
MLRLVLLMLLHWRGRERSKRSLASERASAYVIDAKRTHEVILGKQHEHDKHIIGGWVNRREQ